MFLVLAYAVEMARVALTTTRAQRAAWDHDLLEALDSWDRRWEVEDLVA